jgi:hypothetical protein
MTPEMRWLVASLWLSLGASCNEQTSTVASGVGSSGSSAAAKPRGGGFSSDLAKEFASATGSGDAKAGSGAPAATAGSGDVKAGSGAPVAKAGSGDPTPPAGSGAPVAKAGSGDPTPPAGSDAKPAGPDSAAAPPKIATGAGPVIQSSGTTPKKVALPAELAAIKFGMLPNWERDVQDAGTLSLSVKIPGGTSSAVFVFRYGYEDASAPADRDAYKKWLATKQQLVVAQDRQAGAAWFLEGGDGRGNPAFRVVVNWGGRKLICYGSLYRDAASSKLGDLRDQTVLQAKQICETIAL